MNEKKTQTSQEALPRVRERFEVTVCMRSSHVQIPRFSRHVLRIQPNTVSVYVRISHLVHVYVCFEACEEMAEHYYMQVSRRFVMMYFLRFLPSPQPPYGGMPPQPHPGAAMHMQAPPGQFMPYPAGPAAPHPMMMPVPMHPYTYPPAAPGPLAPPPGPPPPGGPPPGQPMAPGYGMYPMPEYVPGELQPQYTSTDREL